MSTKQELLAEEREAMRQDMILEAFDDLNKYIREHFDCCED